MSRRRNLVGVGLRTRFLLTYLLTYVPICVSVLLRFQAGFKLSSAEQLQLKRGKEANLISKNKAVFVVPDATKLLKCAIEQVECEIDRPVAAFACSTLAAVWSSFGRSRGRKKRIQRSVESDPLSVRWAAEDKRRQCRSICDSSAL